MSAQPAGCDLFSGSLMSVYCKTVYSISENAVTKKVALDKCDTERADNRLRSALCIADVKFASERQG